MATTEPTTYRDRYALAVNTPSAPFMTPFAVGAAPTPASILTSFASADESTPKVLVALTSDAPSLVRYVHRVTRYSPVFGTNSTWDDKVIALSDDVGAGNAYNLVELPDNVFHLTQNLQVLTSDQITTRLQADATLTQFGPHAQGDADTETIRTRMMMAVPPRYASQMIGHPAETARSFWLRVILPIIQSGEAADCVSLVDWARVALTVATNGSFQLQNVGDIDSLQPDTVLKERAWKWVTDDLPALRTNTQPMLQQMVAGQQQIQQLIQQQNQQHLAARAAASAPATVRSMYPQGISVILRMCNVADEAALASLVTCPLLARLCASQER